MRKSSTSSRWKNIILKSSNSSSIKTQKHKWWFYRNSSNSLSHSLPSKKILLKTTWGLYCRSCQSISRRWRRPSCANSVKKISRTSNQSWNVARKIAANFTTKNVFTNTWPSSTFSKNKNRWRCRSISMRRACRPRLKHGSTHTNSFAKAVFSVQQNAHFACNRD